MLPPTFDPTLWDADELEIWKSMGYRCIVCGRWGDTLHEIVPKSKTKDWKRKGNRIVICMFDHTRIHKDGASTWKLRLEILRDKALRNYGDKNG